MIAMDKRLLLFSQHNAPLDPMLHDGHWGGKYKNDFSTSAISDFSCSSFKRDEEMIYEVGEARGFIPAIQLATIILT